MSLASGGGNAPVSDVSSAKERTLRSSRAPTPAMPEVIQHSRTRPNRAARRFPVGAEAFEAGTHFRIWAPLHRTLSVVIEDGPDLSMTPEPEGYFSARVEGVGAGARYGFRIPGDSAVLADPASRYQPDGPHGASQIVDALAFPWTDARWKGVREAQVIYEIHIGAFTPEGTWTAAAARLEHLAQLGVTTVEVMPVHDFAGRYGWGYDSVDLFAPTRLYGPPDAMRGFVDRAHASGLAVILDVVYNHFGPDGCVLSRFSGGYFSDRYETDWGPAINFDGPDSAPVREFVLANAAYWIEEFHLDGLRVDATQNVRDESEDHILAGIVRAARAAAKDRRILMVGENEPQDVGLLGPEGYGFDALWNDDFHHAALVSLTGRREAYYMDYGGSPQEFVSAAKYGYLYQGQQYKWQGSRRGTPTFGRPASSFIHYLENHDQVANSVRGSRLSALTSPGRLRAMTMLLLLGPQTPLLFQGQEWFSDSPFLYFADHDPPLKGEVRKGRREFLGQFRNVRDPMVAASLPDPADPETFRRSKLDSPALHAPAYAFHQDLLQQRREDPVVNGAVRRAVDGAVLGDRAFVLRYFGGPAGDRLLVVNLGADLIPDIVPEPLLSPPRRQNWRVVISSENPAYGGQGKTPLDEPEGWRLPGEAAALLAAPCEQ